MAMQFHCLPGCRPDPGLVAEDRLGMTATGIGLVSHINQ